MYRSTLSVLLLLALLMTAYPQAWEENYVIFNPSGVPSLPFSQPRFADLDNDGDMDMILGSISSPPLYLENTGSSSSPQFQPGDDLFSSVGELDCEIGVCVDLDADGDLDFISGGYTGLQLFDNTGSAESAVFEKIAGFFDDLALAANPVPHFADMDGDDDLDLVIGLSESGEVHYYQNYGTPDAAIFIGGTQVSWFDVGLYAYPWFSDMDADGDSDLLVGKDGYGFNYYQNVGSAASLVWTQSSSQFSGLGNTTYWNSPCLVDLTGDGKQDLVHGTSSGPLKYFRNTGSLSAASWTEVTSLFGGVLDVGGASTPRFVDFDGDGDQDMFSGSTLGYIKYFENVGTPTSPAWSPNHSSFASVDHSIYSAVYPADLDDDGLIDLIVGDLSGDLYFHRNTGSGFPVQSGFFAGINVGGFSNPVLYDLDSDQDLDLVIGREDGTISCYENTGTSTSATWTADPTEFSGIDVGSNAVVTFGDVNNDDWLDMVVGDLFREIQIFTKSGDGWVDLNDEEWLSGLDVGQNATPALINLNGGPNLDLVVGNYDGTFQYYENLLMSGIENRNGPNSSVLHSAFPNPFNPEVNIRYDLVMAQNVSLDVYDLTGARVRNLIAGTQSSGVHELSWNGLAEDGNPASSGIYIVVFEGQGFRHTQRITLLR